jgi:hypothetical protein
MKSSQLEDELLLLEDAMEANYSLGVRLENLRSYAPDFDTVSQEELIALGPATTDADRATLSREDLDRRPPRPVPGSLQQSQ